VLKWADHVAQGLDDRQQVLFDAKLVEGGTIAPAGAAGRLRHPDLLLVNLAFHRDHVEVE